MSQHYSSLPALVKLGSFLREYVAYKTAGDNAFKSVPAPFSAFDEVLLRATAENAWFTEAEILFALHSWAGNLREETLSDWLGRYTLPAQNPLTVALIMAGNIPLVGFHDFLSVLVCRHKALVKCSAKDQRLLPFLAQKLMEYDPDLEGCMEFTTGQLDNFDAVIATGSNNTSRYFEYYFADKPHIIRKNRNSVAVLNGKETQADLSGLASDVFRYFGMGCRSVSKLYVPGNYDFSDLFKAFYEFRDVINHHKYANNYDYNKAVYLMSGSQMLDNDFLLLKEDTGFGSPIGTLFYEHYESEEALKHLLEQNNESIQCLVGDMVIPGAIPFGKAQKPDLSDYADGVDTVEFLLKNSIK
ncbi:acyl-CoA reductase [Robiginitalea sp. IMCC43444]|uniref:acyl-CoA reductase n=1 Tax=Robiginitalea sp. IMCC43444 TaxID=3459121 RepID=UPI0040430802